VSLGKNIFNSGHHFCVTRYSVKESLSDALAGQYLSWLPAAQIWTVERTQPLSSCG